MSLPKASRALVIELATKAWAKSGNEGSLPERFFFAVRGYYRDSMGATGKNDVGIFDDACFWVTPTSFTPVNWNTDSSKLGWNPGVGKPFPLLQTGVWWVRRGPHKGKTPAFRQCTDEEAQARGIPNDGEFTVLRCWGIGDKRNYLETGYFAINLHPGGEANTSSWGCQTAPASQARAFLKKAWDNSESAAMNKIAYILVDGPII